MVVRRKQDAPEVDEVIHIDLDSSAGSPATEVGDLAQVKITGFFEYDMSGELVASGLSPAGREKPV